MSAAATGRGAEALGVTIPGADRLIWYFMRVSGIALIVLVGGHLFITHYLNVPSDTTFDFVSARWANPLWRSFDWLLLLTALWHGIFGLRYSIQDYIGRPGWRVAVLGIAYAVGFIFMAVGTITVFTFSEAAARDNTGPLAGQMWIAQAIGWSLYVFAFVTYVAIVLLVIWVIRGLAGGGLPLYQGDVGQYAWALHRATGIGILFFLLVHIIDIMLIGLGRDVYNESVAFYSRIELIPMEILLVGAVVYHALNGLRVIAIDFSRAGYRRERPLFWTVLIVSVLLVLPSAIALLASHR